MFILKIISVYARDFLRQDQNSRTVSYFVPKGAIVINHMQALRRTYASRAGVFIRLCLFQKPDCEVRVHTTEADTRITLVAMQEAGQLQRITVKQADRHSNGQQRWQTRTWLYLTVHASCLIWPKTIYSFATFSDVINE